MTAAPYAPAAAALAEVARVVAQRDAWKALAKAMESLDIAIAGGGFGAREARERLDAARAEVQRVDPEGVKR